VNLVPKLEEAEDEEEEEEEEESLQSCIYLFGVLI
jgi:hypothetical protein